MGSIMINGVEFPAVRIDELPAIASPAIGGAAGPVMLGGQAGRLTPDQIKDYLNGLGGIASEDDVAAALLATFGAGIGGMWRNGVMPTLDLDFTSRNGAPFKGNLTRSSVGGYVRNSSGAMVPTANSEPLVDFGADGKPLGTGFFGPYTQLLLNSGALSTQNVTTTAQSYTLSFWGTGSVTLSGSATGTLVGTGTDNRVSLTVTATAGALTLTVSGTVTRAMLTAGNVVYPYVESAGATVARNLDSMLIGGADFADFCNPNEGTVFAEFMVPSSSSGGYILSLSDGGSINLSLVRTSANLISVQSSSGWAATVIGPAITPTAMMRAALSYKAGEVRLGVNGVATYVDTSITLQAMTTLYIGRTQAGTQHPNGYIRRLTYWPKALTQAQLEDMTR
ncbi:LamG-like jellyroll fold domain-containing protein [Mycoplana ramosa]|uniref:LamG-like jellyroll fold domain-containing protein n=1 Tax=Mycoplana ramosa TaxID=40837 RepID=A0ABW3YWK2_MYCRA